MSTREFGHGRWWQQRARLDEGIVNHLKTNEIWGLATWRDEWWRCILDVVMVVYLGLMELLTRRGPGIPF